LDDFNDNYFFDGLKAFDFDEMLVDPRDYDDELRGTVVKVGFTLRREVCCRNDKRQDSFAADITELCVMER
jgi:hypothetical protein